MFIGICECFARMYAWNKFMYMRECNCQYSTVEIAGKANSVINMLCINVLSLFGIKHCI